MPCPIPATPIFARSLKIRESDVSDEDGFDLARLEFFDVTVLVLVHDAVQRLVAGYRAAWCASFGRSGRSARRPDT